MLPTRSRTLYVARVSTRRSSLALAFASLAVGALLAVRPLASSGGRFGETLGFEIFLAMLALAFAVRSPRRDQSEAGAWPERAFAGHAGAARARNPRPELLARWRLPTDRDAGQRRALSIRIRTRRSPRRNARLRAAELRAATGYRRGNPLPRPGAARPPRLRYGPIPAILLASVFFGALHVDPIHSVFAAILGLYLGAIAYLAGSVRASMGCHVVNNTAAVLGAAVTPGIGPMPTPSLSSPQLFP